MTFKFAFLTFFDNFSRILDFEGSLNKDNPFIKDNLKRTSPKNLVDSYLSDLKSIAQSDPYFESRLAAFRSTFKTKTKKTKGAFIPHKDEYFNALSKFDFSQIIINKPEIKIITPTSNFSGDVWIDMGIKDFKFKGVGFALHISHIVALDLGKTNFSNFIEIQIRGRESFNKKHSLAYWIHSSFKSRVVRSFVPNSMNYLCMKIVDDNELIRDNDVKILTIVKNYLVQNSINIQQSEFPNQILIKSLLEAGMYSNIKNKIK
ncbi:MAG: hypothetical protein ACMVP2_24650 [Imperialibacter sp.]|uniref:hypothetical protein n=1 Tax=Imperialibacter sp. TaxID=2038411 RepID=UPI003A8C6C45